MPIELTCTGCGQALRVGEDHAGKKARCPKCGAISVVPVEQSPPISSVGPSPFAEEEPGDEPANPFRESPHEKPNPYQSPTSPPDAGMPRHYTPHRGELILTLGILGFLCCGIFGVVAWAMGSADMKEIRAERMDPAGRGLTQAGMILGIIATIFMGIGILIQVMALFGAAAR